MSFIAVGISAAAALGGGYLAAEGAKDAAKIAKGGSDQQIAYNRESRDIALDLSTPYREAGYAGLDKIGAMTGLLEPGGSFGRPAYESAGQTKANYAESGYLPPEWDGQTWTTRPIGGGDPLIWDDSSQSWMGSRGSAYGAPSANQSPNDFSEGSYNAIRGRAYGGVMYNVNELGPESVYSGGKITRSANPKTMPPDPRGYVHPNIRGRAVGGSMVDPNSMGDSSTPVSPGYIDDRTGQPVEPWRRNMIDAGNLDPNDPGSNITTTQGGVMGTPVPQENPYDFTTDPGYIFRFNEGQRMLERGAAARGGLLSGGFARKAIRYGQDYASNEFSNIYNRIANVAGLGQVSAHQGGVFAQNAGANMGNAASQGATSSAYGQMAGTNAWANAANQIAQLPWDDFNWKNPFGGSSTGGSSTGGLPGGRGFN